MRSVVMLGLVLLCGAKCGEADTDDDAYDQCRSAYVQEHPACFENGVQVCLNQIQVECNFD